MTTNKSKFFIIDFDRCIGNIEACFNVLNEVVHDLSVVDREIFKSMRKKVELDGLSFSALEHIKEYYPSVDMDVIEKMYMKNAQNEPNNLLEPGARIFLDYLKSTGQQFCIMSFGDKRWQTLKINSSGIKDTPIVIVPKSQKSTYIQKWFDPKGDKFIIPKECFLDNISRSVDEVILVDDKTDAFINLPKKARGYLVLGSSIEYTKSQLNNIPKSVMQISYVDEIIDHEFTTK